MKCQECNGDLVVHNGYYVCSNCGLVYDPVYVYDFPTLQYREKMELSNSDYKLYNEIKKLLKSLGLTNLFWYVYRTAKRHRRKNNTKLKTYLAAIILYHARKEGMPLRMKRLEEVTGIKQKHILRTIDRLGLKLYPVTPKAYLSYFLANKLQFFKVVDPVDFYNDVLSETKQLLAIEITGDPYNIAAAIFYLSVKKALRKRGKNTSMKEIAKLLNVPEFSIRDKSEQLKKEKTIITILA